MGRRILSLLLALTAGVGLACRRPNPVPAEGQEAAAPKPEQRPSDRLCPRDRGGPRGQAATLLAETWGATWWRWARKEDPQPQRLRVCPPGLCPQPDNALPAAVETFLDTYDFWGPDPLPLRPGDGERRGFPPRRSLPAPARAPAGGAGPPLHPGDGGGGPSPSGPSPCPWRWGPCPEGVRETPWPPPR